MRRILPLILFSLSLILLASCGKVEIGQPHLGSSAAPIEMLVFSDYKCAYCHDFAKNILPKLKQDYIDTGILKLTYYDLPTINEDSWSFAHLGHCAHNTQPELFWSIHLLLFDHSQSYSEQTLLPLLEAEGYNSEQLQSCLADPQTEEAVIASKRVGDQRNIQGTPTFVVGSQKVSGLFSYSFFQQAIEAEQKRLQAASTN